MTNRILIQTIYCATLPYFCRTSKGTIDNEEVLKSISHLVPTKEEPILSSNQSQEETINTTQSEPATQTAEGSTTQSQPVTQTAEGFTTQNDKHVTQINAGRLEEEATPTSEPERGLPDSGTDKSTHEGDDGHKVTFMTGHDMEEMEPS